MPSVAIGVDIGGTNLRAARITADGTVLARARAPSDRDPAVVLDRLLDLISEVDGPEVAGIGIGVPGRVDFARRAVLGGGYVDLSRVPLAQAIEDCFTRPVVIDNDASMALVAEAALGAGHGARHLALLTIGTGIGGGLMEDGRILRGRAIAGQLGHIPVDPAGPSCLCGRRGCVEAMSSGTALGGLIREAGLPAGTSAATLLDRARAGDELSRGVLGAWAAPLRRAVDALVATLDIERVVLGGGLGGEAVAALGLLPEERSWYHTDVVAARLGDDAGIVGSALAALAASAGKRLVMVNGVPASGKSSVARALSEATGWPVYALDTVKDPFLAELGAAGVAIDRPFNRVLGRASYRAIFALIAAAPPGSTAIVDAWFGFQPQELLEELATAAGVGEIVEVWCRAAPAVVADRYRNRPRLPGHPGAEYAAELEKLATTAQPMALGRVHVVDTGAPVGSDAVLALANALREG